MVTRRAGPATQPLQVGVQLVSAYGWREGWDLAQTALPDLILLDIDMPEHSGLDLCRSLKADPRTAGIPIIFLTGAMDVNTKVHGFDLGAIEHGKDPDPEIYGGDVVVVYRSDARLLLRTVLELTPFVMVWRAYR